MASIRRIIVIGCAGGGKSTLAREMGEILDLEVIHLDRLFWRPGWVETPREEWRAIQEEFLRREAWIIDGNYGSTMSLRLAAADTVIFLDFPRLLCLVRVIKRWLANYGRTRPDLGPGCPEGIDLEFIRWIWNFRSRSRPRILANLAGLSGDKELIVLRRPREVRRFLQTLSLSQDGERRA